MFLFPVGWCNTLHFTWLDAPDRHYAGSGFAQRRDQMMTTANKIESEISALPPHLQAEVLDFVQFVKQRHGIGKVPIADKNAQSGGDSPFFQALSEAGFVGCIETDEQLSTSYKKHIDFFAKVGAQA
jgi:hypothetical protein